MLNKEEGFLLYAPKVIFCVFAMKFSQEDDFQKILRYTIINEKRFYLTSCEMNGQRYLRVVLINPATTLAHLKDLLVTIKKTAARIAV